MRYVDARNTLSGKKIFCTGSKYTDPKTQKPFCNAWEYVDSILNEVDGEGGTPGRPATMRNNALPVNDRE
jgi:hypothetical protein